jgi:hypothetical protein
LKKKCTCHFSSNSFSRSKMELPFFQIQTPYSILCLQIDHWMM